MESLAINSGVGTSVVHGMSVLVRVQTPEPIRENSYLGYRERSEKCHGKLLPN